MLVMSTKDVFCFFLNKLMVWTKNEHHCPCSHGSIDGLVKVKNLRKRMEKFTEAVNGLKEGKQEMSKQVEELAASTDALMAKIKVSFSTGKPPKVYKTPFHLLQLTKHNDVMRCSSFLSLRSRISFHA